MKKNKKRLSYKDCNSTIAQLISAEEMASLYNLKAKIERQNNRIKRRENKEKYNGRWQKYERLLLYSFYLFFIMILYKQNIVGSVENT